MCWKRGILGLSDWSIDLVGRALLGVFHILHPSSFLDLGKHVHDNMFKSLSCVQYSYHPFPNAAELGSLTPNSDM